MDSTFKGLVAEYGAFFEDARRRLSFVLIFFALIFVVTFFLSPTLINQIIDLLNFPNVSYVVNAPFQIIGLSIDLALSVALVATVPLLFVEIYEFVHPALKASEKRNLIVLVALSGLLFIVGFLYGLIIMYYGYDLVSTFNAGLSIQNLWSIDVFFSQLLLTSALLGILFQFPVLILILVELDFLGHLHLLQYRRIVIATVFLFVALLPPTDGLSLIAMALPLIGLYELTVMVARRRTTKKSHAQLFIL